MTYPVTTIGAPCACAPAPAPATIGGFDNLMILFPPLWPAWVGSKLAGAGIEKLTGKNPNEGPSPINELAKTLGIDPVVLALKIMGHEGWGHLYEPMKLGALAVGAVSSAYLFVKWKQSRGAKKAKPTKAIVRKGKR